jgi:hypothetical protein
MRRAPPFFFLPLARRAGYERGRGPDIQRRMTTKDSGKRGGGGRSCGSASKFQTAKDGARGREGSVTDERGPRPGGREGVREAF